METWNNMGPQGHGLVREGEGEEGREGGEEGVSKREGGGAW